MSMNATFVQVEEAELARMKANPDLAETLFQDDAVMPPVFTALSKTMQERVRTAGPQLMADALSRMDPALRKQIEDSLGRTMAAMSGGAGGAEILKMMQERGARREGGASLAGQRATLSLDKEWHGVHYVLCGQVEPGASLLSQAVLGGVDLGDDDEGFSGYGPARYFSVAQVAEIARALGGTEVEAEAAARFDAERMVQLQIYPGWRRSDLDGVMDAFRRLRDFYSDAAGKGRAIVTCLM